MLRKLVLLSALLGALAVAVPAQHYTFVVTGDGRSAGMPGRPALDRNGINVTIGKELVRECLRLHPKFLLFNGDLVAGYTTEEGFHSQLNDWLQMMKPLYAAGIHVYPVRGNHDAYSKNAVKVWDEVFSGPYALPKNGPSGEKNMTFFAREENALVISVDQWGAHEHAVNQGWLNNVLAQNRLPHIFTLGHEMAFMAGHHTDNLDNNAHARDVFITSLAQAGARVYFAGHDHFYDHMQITDPDNHPGLNMHQFVVGTAGAPFYAGAEYKGHNGSWTLTQIKHIANRYGYILGEVNGLHVRLAFFGRTAPGRYEAMDALQYDVKPSK